MNRDQKAQAVDEIATRISESNAIYATDYRGITVAQAATLRARLRDAGASFRVVKNTLTLRAADKAGAEDVKRLVEGPTAFAFVQGDPALAAKALDTFARQENVLDVRGGLLDGGLLDGDAFRRLARLPGREQLNAQVAGVVAAPLTGLVRGLGSLLGGIAIALGQISEKKGADAPSEAPATEETAERAADEAAAQQPESDEQQPPEQEKEEADQAETEQADSTQDTKEDE
jgi:large subunit ribosomal protein L10